MHFGRMNVRWQYHTIGGDSLTQLTDSLEAGRDLGVVVDEESKLNKLAETAVANHLRPLA